MSNAWTMRKLRDLATIRVSNVDKKSFVGEKPIKLCNYMDVYSNEYITSSIQFMEASATATEIERFSIHSGDIIITKDSETPDDIGIPTVVVESIDGLVCGYHLALIRPNADKLDPIYLSKQLSTSRIARYFALHASGSTRYGLPVSAIESVDIPTPPKPEQTKIAEILYTIDQAIKQTEALIAKQQRIKTGLMQDLLTHGIDEYGNIRSEQTHKFKDSPLGRIPTEWKTGSILDFASRSRQAILTGPFGAQLGSKDFVEEGVPVLRIGNVQSGYIDQSDLLFVSEQKATRLSRYRVQAGDLLFARQGATTGRNALAGPHEEGFLINYHIIRVAIDQTKCSPTFLYAAFNSEMVQSQVEKEKAKGTREGVNTATLMAFVLPIPSMDEQIRLSNVIIAHSKQMEDVIAQLVKLRSLKTALMQDLLTGKKRVTDLLNEMEDMSAYAPG